MIRPWLFLFRFRIYAAIAVSLLMMLLFAAAMNLFSSDSSCACPGANLTSLRMMLEFSLLPAIIGYVFGWSFTVGAVGASGVIPGANSYPRFLLTRPISRNALLCAPLLICLVALTLLPALTIALILGALQLFHPAGIAHLFTIASLLPAVHALGPHPSPLQILLAIDLPRRYLAGISIGLCAYTLMASQRWLVLSPDRRLQYVSVIPTISIVLPTTLRFLNARLVSAILLDPARGAELTYLPSNLGIALHLAIAAAIALGTWRVMRTAEV